MENNFLYNVIPDKDFYTEKTSKYFSELESCDKDCIGRNILKILVNIHLYSWYEKDKVKIKQDYERIEKLLDKYDEHICVSEKLHILFHIKDCDFFKRYLNKHKEQFDKIMTNTVLHYDDMMAEFDGSFEFQYLLNIKYGVGKFNVIELSNIELGNSYNIFSSFDDIIRITERDIFGFDYSFLFKGMTFFELKDLVLKELQKEGKYLEKSIEELLNKYLSEKVDASELYELLSYPKINKIFFEKLMEYLKFFTKMYFEAELFLELLDKVIILFEYGNIGLDDEFNNIEKFFSVQCFFALKKLNQLSPQDRKNDSLYLKCFKLFLEEMINNFGGELDNESVIVFSNLFHRLIARSLTNLNEILLIHDKKMLYHYYKTDEILSNLPVTFEQIKTYNAKQYISLKKMTNSRSVLVLEALIYFGYDYCKNSNLLNSKGCSVLLKYIRKKSNTEIEKFKRFLEKDFSVLFNDKYDIESIISMYDYLTLNGVEKITISKVIKCLDSVENILLPNNRHIGSNLSKLNFIAKGDPLLEKVAGILLYDEYRFRVLSTIPDISGKLNDYYYQMVDMHDSNIISNGIGNYVLPNQKISSSCLTPNGKASSCLKHGATNENGRFFKVSKNDEIVAYSWVWRCGDVLCFDNIEVTNEFMADINYEEILFRIYKIAADKLIKITSKLEDRGIKLVVVGRNPIDIKIKQLEKLSKVNDYTSTLFKPNAKEELYLKDSEQVQVILSGSYDENLNLQDVKAIYKCKRRKINKFTDLNCDELKAKINSIYFDYSIDNGIKYKEILPNDYVDGFINEDWFVGTKKDGKREVFYTGKDDRKFKEIEQSAMCTVSSNSSISIIKPKSEFIGKILDEKNYRINIDGIQEYLKFYETSKYNSDEMYLHGASSLNIIASILLDGKITSNHYGGRMIRGGNNGSYFISLAKKEKEVSLMQSCRYLPSFVLDKDICVFSTNSKNTIPDKVARMFVDSSYPIRPNLAGNEYQALNYISLNRAKAIAVNELNSYDIARLFVLQDYLDINLPLVGAAKEQIIEKEAVKKYIKFTG